MNLVYLELVDGKIKKSGFEALYVASKLGGDVVGIAIGEADETVLAEAGNYGASGVIFVPETGTFENSRHASIVAQFAKEAGAKNIILSQTYTGKAVAPQIAVKTGASVISGVVDMPVNGAWKRSVFSGKAFAYAKGNASHQVILLVPNSFTPEKTSGNAVVTKKEFPSGTSGVTTRSVEKIKAGGKIPLTEAEIVVSGGRGMKGPENWGSIETLADLLNAATACSKPVSDMHWRPHTEHVGQTGITIKPNLYIAIGISGAIQHLAGVSSSKVIVVINKDPEAPFFKAADYGIVGDAFEILPKLIDAANAAKQAQ